MQIRLTVVDPLGPAADGRGRAASRDVLVTAPAGTALASVASALATAVTGDAAERPERGGAPVLYAGEERLDAQRCTLGEPPLVDGAVLSVGAPAGPEPHPEVDDAPAQLHVVAGPDAGGVHLLHGGQVRIGRSADADVPLDDPDVSRLHCAVTLAADGRVSVADLGSTNGTVLDGTPVDGRPVRFAPGALLRIGESALRLSAPACGPMPRLATAPDGEGHIRVTPGAPAAEHSAPQEHTRAQPPVVPGQAGAPLIERRPLSDSDTHAGRTGAGRPGDSGTGAGGGGETGRGSYGSPSSSAPTGSGGSASSPGSTGSYGSPSSPGSTGSGGSTSSPGSPEPGTREAQDPDGGARRGAGGRRRGGLSAWARRLAGGRGEPETRPEAMAYDVPGADVPARPSASAPVPPDTWPDPAALLLTALGPGPRLWERGPGHPEALTVRLGTADRTAPDGSGLLPAVPVTADLREAGSLGLAGPRPRLAGLARAVLAQLSALHSPDTLDIVLISTDRARPVEERTAEWSWLGWLPHLRPGHGQDCRLLLAYDREQAAARAEELLRRLEDHLAERRRTPRPAPGTSRAAIPAGASVGTGPARVAGTDAPQAPVPGPSGTHPVPGSGAPSAAPAPLGTGTGAPTPAADAPLRNGTASAHPTPRRPSWARDDAGSDRGTGFSGPYTVVVVDGDPGGAGLREAVARLAAEGPRAGIHVLCLAETPAASPLSPVTETYDAACAVAPTFPECGAVALLSGDVAGALRLLRVAPAGPRRAPVGHGTVGTVDAVSAAWAERFARALAPLRTDGSGERHPRVSAPLPQAARLLDELGLARATPASLMARWADAADDTSTPGGRASAVLGAGPRGPVVVDLVADGPHLLVEGPPGSGRTELLRAVVASLAAAERPDRLGIVLMDGRDSVGVGSGHGDGLHVCTDVPHVTTHLLANDPVRMREFAQSLSAELKRRAELLGREDFAAWHTRQQLSGRLVAQRTAPGTAAPRAHTPGAAAPHGPTPGAPGTGAADLDAPPSSTLRLRPGAARRQAEAAPPLPRLVVVVDDLDALVSPALGSPGRPAAGSVMRALEAVAREGGRLGVHLVAASAPDGRTAETEPARRAALRVTLDAPAPGPDEPAPGRGRLTGADGRATAFQGGRVTGRIPRTATLRPTVVPLDWQRMGDPPTRRPVRELGNGPTDLALLASALERAAREVAAAQLPSLL
ncbi:FHA domain-containing protein [Streptomyces sp. enrichment culture]|uniref:FHA domain-containing protein n=1 Tax=Streptomyces sp. enrichment culture TaxID=1795815 RepID=UPI003F543915